MCAPRDNTRDINSLASSPTFKHKPKKNLKAIISERAVPSCSLSLSPFSFSLSLSLPLFVCVYRAWHRVGPCFPRRVKEASHFCFHLFVCRKMAAGLKAGHLQRWALAVLQYRTASENLEPKDHEPHLKNRTAS